MTPESKSEIDLNKPSNTQLPWYGYSGPALSILLPSIWMVLFHSDYEGLAYSINEYSILIGIFVVLIMMITTIIASQVANNNTDDCDKEDKSDFKLMLIPFFITLSLMTAFNALAKVTLDEWIPSNSSSVMNAKVLDVAIGFFPIMINYRIDTTGGSYFLKNKVASIGDEISIQTRTSKDGFMSAKYVCYGNECSPVLKEIE